MVTLYDRLKALRCPYDDDLLATADAAYPPPPWWVCQGESVFVVTYDPMLAEQPLLLTVHGSSWEFSFAPDGGIDRARRGSDWILETGAKESAFAEFVGWIADVSD